MEINDNIIVYYSDDYTAAEYAFDTTRKADHVAAAVRPSVTLAAPDQTFDLTRIHTREYVDAVQTGTPLHLAESQGFRWDHGLAVAAQAHTDGLVSAVHEVLTRGYKRSGSLSSGLHHASRKSGHGFCTYNGLAAAAITAGDLGCERILSLDFDAHCGGGTFNIMQDDPRWTQIDVSTSVYDDWNGDTRHHLTVSNPNTYLRDILAALDRVRAESWDIIIYNAGVDPINCGVTERDLRLREMIVSEIIGDTPAVFALAGGYTWGDVTMDQLVELHSSTVLEWADSQTGGYR